MDNLTLSSRELNEIKNKNIEEVVIPEGTTFLKSSLFKSFKNLKRIKMPQSLCKIGDDAFYDCKNLEEIEIPNGVTYIGVSAFENCESLREIRLPNKLSVILLNTFRGCKNLQNVIFPKNIKRIDTGAFSGAISLREITIPSTMEFIQDNAFPSNMKKITVYKNGDSDVFNGEFLSNFRDKELIISEGFKSIASESFAGSHIKRIILSEGMENIQNKAFKDSMLEYIKLPSTLVKIGENAFFNSHIKELEFSGGISAIGVNAFYKCNKLEKISLPQGLKSIGNGAFSECETLKEISLPSTLSYIGYGAFSKCKMEEITLPDSVEIVEGEAFSYCQNLKRVKLPQNLKLLSLSTFEGCESLKDVVLPESISRIEFEAFKMCRNLERINLPQELKFLGKEAFIECRKLREITLPETLRVIESSTFENCKSLSRVEFKEGLKVISTEAFKGCAKLKSISLPKTLEKIETGAFSECSLLENITLLAGTVEKGSFDLSGANLKQLTFTEDVNILDNCWGGLKYITKIDDKFIMSNTALSPESLDISLVPCQIGALVANWDRKEAFLKDLKNSDFADVVNAIYPYLDKKDFNNFCQNKNLKIYKQLPRIEDEKARGNFIRFYFALGGFMPPIEEKAISKSGKEVIKVVDYAQKVGEFMKEKIKHVLTEAKVKNMVKMPIDGLKFKRDYTNFIINETNFMEMLKESEKHNDIFIRSYNLFEEVQATNTKNKGHQKELKPTVAKFIQYFKEDKFRGVNKDTRLIAEVVGRYFFKQETFDKAVMIAKERLEHEDFQDHILGEPLKEEGIFEAIENYTEDVKLKSVDALSMLTDLANKKFTFEWLAKSDPNNYILGKLCSCCASLECTGFGIMHASIVHPDIQNLVIKKDDGQIIAKSTLYVNRSEGYGVYNTVEVNENVTNEEKRVVYQKFKLASKLFAKRYNQLNPNRPLKIMTVGMNSNDLKNYIQTNDKDSSEIYDTINFGDYGDGDDHYNGDSKFSQYVVWEDELEK